MIFIPFPEHGSIGGPQTFMNNLKHYLDKKNYNYFNKIDKASAIFFPIQYDLTVLEKFKKKNGKIIQRLDGIYYPQKHGESYLQKNSKIKKIYHDYADFIIFQSEYCKNQCFELFGKIEESKYKIIHNGVNKEIFTPKENCNETNTIKIISTGNFRNIDMIEPLIKAFDVLINDIEFDFQIVGPVTHEKIKNLIDRNYVTYLGEKNTIAISELLKSADIFVYSHLNPPCPNSVIEAISCGLPVVGFDSGSMKELCWFSKDLLAHVSNEIIQNYNDFDYEKLIEKLKFCMTNLKSYQDRALTNSSQYSFEYCGTEYIKVFNEFINNRKSKKFNLFSRIKI